MLHHSTLETLLACTFKNQTSKKLAIYLSFVCETNHIATMHKTITSYRSNYYISSSEKTHYSLKSQLISNT